MRVEYNTVASFLSDLALEKDCVWEKAVRLRIDRQEKANCETTLHVGLCLTAVVKKEGGDFLMEMNAYCGDDIEDSNPDRSGSEKAASIEKEINAECNSLGLKVRPGKYEVY